MQQNFTIESEHPLLNSIPSRFDTVYMKTLYSNGVINEMYNKYKVQWFKRKVVSQNHVGVWGWNSWCGIHSLNLLAGDKFQQVLRNTIEVGLKNPESTTGLLPHAVLHENGKFASKIEYMCYSGKTGEAYNLDNMICWAKMAMEYYLVTGDSEWFIKFLPAILKSIDYMLDNCRNKFNRRLINIGIEGDWTECTDWELDNANVNVNMIECLRLLIESLKLSKPSFSIDKNYEEIRKEMIIEFNKTVEEGGFWSDQNNYYIHGNDGGGDVVHGDKYFEATTNYFALLWGIVPEEKEKLLWNYINSVSDKLEFPYPVLTNLYPRTGARRKNYGQTVTNGDVWMVLGAHAAAARFQFDFLEHASRMYNAILDYEKKEGTLHNCIYSHGRVNDTWDPEIANYGALYVPFVLGVLGANPIAEGLALNIKKMKGIDHLKTQINFREHTIKLALDYSIHPQIRGTIDIFDQSGKNVLSSEISNSKFIIGKDLSWNIKTL